MKEINRLKKGDFFMLKAGTPKDSNVWIFAGYNRHTRKYSAYRFSDIGSYLERKKGTKIFTDFEF